MATQVPQLQLNSNKLSLIQPLYWTSTSSLPPTNAQRVYLLQRNIKIGSKYVAQPPLLQCSLSVGGQWPPKDILSSTLAQVFLSDKNYQIRKLQEIYSIPNLITYISPFQCAYQVSEVFFLECMFIQDILLITKLKKSIKPYCNMKTFILATVSSSLSSRQILQLLHPRHPDGS